MNTNEALFYSNCREIQQSAYNLYLHEKVAVKAEDTILDVGCGPGQLVYDMGKVAQLAVGFDIAEEMIDVARQKYQGENIAYEVADIVNCLETFPNWRGAFNKIVSVHVLHWVKEKKEAFQNIFDCLKPGGECFLLYTGPTNQLNGFKRDELPYYLANHNKWKHYLKGFEYKYYNQLTLEDNMALLKSVGFEVVNGDLHTPCDNIDIYSKDHLRGIVRTLVNHINYVPEQHKSEILEDATNWCYDNFPTNHRGNKYIKLDIIVLRAKKTFQD